MVLIASLGPSHHARSRTSSAERRGTAKSRKERAGCYHGAVFTELAAERDQGSEIAAVKSLDSFDFTPPPSLNKALLELARSKYALRRERP
jgi:hypothetical protein